MTRYNEHDATIKLPNGMVAHRYQIITTDVIIHTAYEPSTGKPGDGFEHSTITHFDQFPETTWGRVGTRRLPAELNAIPVGEERFAAVGKFHRAIYDESVAAIIEAFPYCAKFAAQGAKRMGEIETRVSDIQ